VADQVPGDEIDAAELAALDAAGLLLIDVRGADEVQGGMLPGALHLAGANLPGEARALATGRTVVAYCATGRRSRDAVAALRAAGVPARSLAGGITAWIAAGQPVSSATGAVTLPPDQRDRYARQLRLPEVGVAGQARLQAARVLCVGAGGLGSPVALYLAAAGVGHMGIIDGDCVELSNLHRQVLHTTPRIGQGKAQSAAEALRALNPDVSIEAMAERLDAANASTVLAGHDLVIDTSDNFATRYLVNDTALELGIPVVHGAVQQFEGQVTVFPAGGRPCYRCLYPAAPPPEAAPSCAEIGVLGVVPGVIGMLQATEALKLLLGIGTLLAGRLVVFDALGLRFHELAVARDPDCRCARGLAAS
jgi:sulfur-carrier protein adenylyltransferase/sulfurtransferase